MSKQATVELPKMNSAVKPAWLSALRGGDLKPCYGALARVQPDGTRRFNPMGVLCNLHAEAHPEFAATQTDPEDYPVHVVAEWAGLNGQYTKDGRYVVPYFAVLMYHDQWQEPDFHRIANWIEENL